MNHQSDNWKEDLRDSFKRSLIGIAEQKDYEFIGYAYKCFAPCSIYKYYSDNPRNLDAVKEQKMWYSAPSKFNDVFDMSFSVDEKAIFECFCEQVPDNRGVREGSYMWKHLQSLAADATKQLLATLEPARHTTGISCFSEEEDSLLMWAHYANNHRGMCVEYEIERFSSELNFTPVPIIYSEQKPSLRQFNLKEPEIATLGSFINSITTKSKEWSYEKEWRIIRDEGACGSAWNGEKQGALLPSIMPKSVILGCDARGEFEKAVHEYCEERKINLFQMEKDEAEYKLNKKQILVFNE